MRIGWVVAAFAVFTIVGVVWTLSSVDLRVAGPLLPLQIMSSIPIFCIVLWPFLVTYLRPPAPKRVEGATTQPEHSLLSPRGLMRWAWSVPVAIALAVPMVSLLAAYLSFGFLIMAMAGAALFAVLWPVIALITSLVRPGAVQFTVQRTSLWLVCSILATGFAVGALGWKEAGFLQG